MTPRALGPWPESPQRAGRNRGPKGTDPIFPDGWSNQQAFRHRPETPGTAGRTHGPSDPSATCPGQLVDPMGNKTLARIPRNSSSTICPGRIWPVPVGPRCQPAVPGDSGSFPRSHGVDQLSRLTQARVPKLAGLARCPCRSGPGLRGRGVELLSLAIWARVLFPMGLTNCPGRVAPGSDGPWVRPAVPGDSGLGPSAHGVDQLSWVTRAHV